MKFVPGLTLSLCLFISYFPCDLNAAETDFGTYAHPYSADSPWNSRPIAPVLGASMIPKSSYSAAIGEGAYSTGIFKAMAGDPSVIVTARSGKAGIWDADAEQSVPSVFIEHWPENVLPAAGSDGHADIVDVSTGVIHSFWQLKRVEDRWTATLYAWSKIDGRGWGDPAHYYQGARASGVPTSAGLIRSHEVNDGKPFYQHALAMSMTFNGLSAEQPYIFPATSADNNASSTNTGEISEGALLMLPETFDTDRIVDKNLRKVALTLKRYGAYVVDRNVGTPFFIYAEIGSGFNLHIGGWNTANGIELDRIRQSLRPVISASGWLDGNDNKIEVDKKLNILSLRGPWIALGGNLGAKYVSSEQSLVFPSSSQQQILVNESAKGMHAVDWARPVSGERYQLRVHSTGGAKLRFMLRNADGSSIVDSGDLDNGGIFDFQWPASNAKLLLKAYSGLNSISKISTQLVNISGIK